MVLLSAGEFARIIHSLNNYDRKMRIVITSIDIDYDKAIVTGV